MNAGGCMIASWKCVFNCYCRALYQVGSEFLQAWLKGKNKTFFILTVLLLKPVYHFGSINMYNFRNFVGIFLLFVCVWLHSTWLRATDVQKSFIFTNNWYIVTHDFQFIHKCKVIHRILLSPHLSSMETWNLTLKTKVFCLHKILPVNEYGNNLGKVERASEVCYFRQVWFIFFHSSVLLQMDTGSQTMSWNKWMQWSVQDDVQWHWREVMVDGELFAVRISQPWMSRVIVITLCGH